MKKLIALLLIALAPNTALAASSALAPKQIDWGFDGITGTFDRPAIQRGFQVYKEVCASCHSLRLLSYRNLEQIGFSKAEVKAIAAEYTKIDGPDGSFSLLTGYKDAPSSVELNDGMYYNPYFPGSQIAMAPPISEDLVSYEDGTPATVDQMSRDTVAFLQWAAEPEMEHRKKMGIKVLLFMLVFTALFIAAKKRVWKKID